MHLLEAVNLVLSMMFLPRSSGLDNVSLPIQSLSLVPPVVSLRARSALPPITQLVDTIFPAVPRWFHLSAAEVAQVSNPPKIDFSIQHQDARLDSPVNTNSSKVISDSPTIFDFTWYSPPATVRAEIVFSPLEWKFILAWILVSLITIEYIYLEELASGISLDVSYSRITVLNVSNCSRFILGIVSCGLLAHYRLSEDANSHAALAGVGTITYMLGEMRFLEALYRIGHVVRILLSCCARMFIGFHW
jgi:hypothetical protein